MREVAMDVLETIRSRPKDSISAFGEYIVAELRELTPEQVAFAKRKMKRAFDDILDDANSLVSAPYINYTSTRH